MAEPITNFLSDGTCIPRVIAASSVSPFVQILSLGFVWVFFHCSPMCGPILAGLRLEAGRGFLFYQLGRAQIYGALGALAGFFGSSFFSNPSWGWILVFVLGLLILIEAFPNLFSKTTLVPRWFMNLTSKVSGYGQDRRAYLLGMLFAFLPCGLALWALSLAATTGSPIQGALLMILLVVMTFFPLLAFQWGMSKVIKSRKRVVTLSLLGVSFVWTLLIVLASNGIISHREFQFTIQNQPTILMFY